MFDLVFLNALIADGSGEAAYKADVAVKDGKIAAIGELKESEAVRFLDAEGLVLSPGFIDIHSHYDCAIFADPLLKSVLYQGVTTVISGQCGDSRAPLNDDMIEDFAIASKGACAGAEIDYSWRSFAEFMELVDKMGIGVNMASLVGHSTVRRCLLGTENRDPNAQELARMKQYVADSLEEGAVAFSTGLVYLPGMYAKTEELIEIAKALKPYGLPYVSHIRSESVELVEAVQEAIHIAKEAGVPCHIAHHKALGRSNWHKVDQTLAIIDEERAKGMDITLDLYPYVYSTSNICAMLPPWSQEGGVAATTENLRNPETRARILAELRSGAGFNNIWEDSGGAEGVIVTEAPYTPQYEGLNMLEASKLSGKDPLETCLDIIMENPGNSVGCYCTGKEENIQKILKKPYAMTGSDAVPCKPGSKCNPRTNGTFPRILSRYCRELGLLGLEEAVHKLTGLPAARLQMKNKGLIKVGMDADITLFDPATIRDMATVKEPFEKPEGIPYVMVNGVMAVENGEYTGARAGRALLRGKC